MMTPLASLARQAGIFMSTPPRFFSTPVNSVVAVASGTDVTLPGVVKIAGNATPSVGEAGVFMVIVKGRLQERRMNVARMGMIHFFIDIFLH
jgi:hypothetical protein